MNLFNYKNVNRRWFSSIRVKFVVVYVLVNIIALQLIGLFFTAQLRTSNINNFEQNIIEQEKILNYHIREELDKDGKKTDNEEQAGSASIDGESIKIEGDVASANAKSGIALTIPNRAVKPFSADGTTVTWESMSPPSYKKSNLNWHAGTKMPCNSKFNTVQLISKICPI